MEMVFAPNQRKMSVADYAVLLNVTPNHLNKAVKGATGKSVLEWIDESLMMSAKMMLRNTDLTISEVAERLGILDPSYFARRFKQLTKISPSEFRRLSRF